MSRTEKGESAFCVCMAFCYTRRLASFISLALILLVLDPFCFILRILISIFFCRFCWVFMCCRRVGLKTTRRARKAVAGCRCLVRVAFFLFASRDASNTCSGQQGFVETLKAVVGGVKMPLLAWIVVCGTDGGFGSRTV